MTPLPLANRTCLITGASRGLGAKLAEVYWSNGASLILVSRSRRSLALLEEGLPERQDQQICRIEADFSSPGAADLIVQKARQNFEKLDVLVNNAAIQGPIGAVWENDWTGWFETLQVNFLTPAKLCSLTIPWMAEQRRGRILNISGGGAVSPRPGFSAYSSAKAALVRFSETIALEASVFGIQVNCVAPGAMSGKMLEAIIEAGPSRAGSEEYARALKTQGNDGAADKAAALCLFLVTEASNGITGKLISAVWDPWQELPQHLDELMQSDVYTQRRIVPKDRGFRWDPSES